MKTLIFDPRISGHHLEYLHHYYIGAIRHPEQEYVFCVDHKFNSLKDLFQWPVSENISFDILTETETVRVSDFSVRSRMNTLRLLRRKIKIFSVQKVLMTDFHYLIPFILFAIPKGVLFRGILYSVYLNNRNRTLSADYYVRKLCYAMMSAIDRIDVVFVLNDRESADSLNSIHNTGKYKYLPDPVPIVDINAAKDIRIQYDIPRTDKVFLHFGGMSVRKGTLDILNSILMSSQVTLVSTTFIFAGVVYDEIREEFYRIVEAARKKTRILVFDQFCPYDVICDFCYSCDIILAPYHITDRSSGVLGYAALFHKPVVGPKSGLMGRIINKYGLGVTIENIDAEGISSVFTKFITCRKSDYCDLNTEEQFIKVLFS